MLQSKQLTINQLRAQLERVETECREKKQDIIKNRQELIQLKQDYNKRLSDCRSFAALIEAKRQEAEAVRDGEAIASVPGSASGATSEVVWGQEVPTNFEWPSDQAAGGATSSVPAVAAHASPAPSTGSTKTKFKYRCLYEFTARNNDEITIKPGDIVMVDTSAASEPDWLSGEINGHVGWFPKDYAVLEDDGPLAMQTEAKFEYPFAASNAPAAEEETSAPAAATSSSGAWDTSTATAATSGGDDFVPLQARALYDYSTEEQGHLTFVKDELIRVTAQHDEWYFGETLDPVSGQVAKSGWFVASYVELLPQDGGQAAASSGNDQDQYYVSLYQFDSIEPGDLSFEVNELIFIEKKDGDWWTGVIVDRATGAKDSVRRGVFPSNYVGPAPAEDIPKAQFTEPVVQKAAVSAASISPSVTKPTPTHQPLDVSYESFWSV